MTLIACTESMANRISQVDCEMMLTRSLHYATFSFEYKKATIIETGFNCSVETEHISYTGSPSILVDLELVLTSHL